MSRKIKILVSVLAVVTLLTAGTTAVVLAQDNAPLAQVETGVRGLLTRVAEKLGIPEKQLADAFNQAQQEITDEAITQKLDNLLAKAVEKGIITEQESGYIKSWWNGRPEAVDKLLPLVNLAEIRDLVMRFDKPINYETLENGDVVTFTQEIFRGGKLPDVAGILQRAVEKGIISQEEADAITTWWNGRPEAVNTLFQNAPFVRPMPYPYRPDPALQFPCFPAR